MSLCKFEEYSILSYKEMEAFSEADDAACEHLTPRTESSSPSPLWLGNLMDWEVCLKADYLEEIT